MADNDLQQWLRKLQKKQAEQSEPTSFFGKLAKSVVDAAVEISEIPPQRPVAGHGGRSDMDYYVDESEALPGIRNDNAPKALSAEKVAMMRKAELAAQAKAAGNIAKEKKAADDLTAGKNVMKNGKSKGRKFARFLHENSGNVRDALVLAEILRPPLGLRQDNDRY